MKSTTKTIKVRITKRDMKEGIQGAAMSCPIALCLHRKTKNRLMVTARGLATFDGEFVAVLPPIAQRFIHRFDYSKTKRIKLISFTIEIPNKFLKKKRYGE